MNQSKALRCTAFVLWLSLMMCQPAHAAGELVFAVARLPLSLPVYVAQARGYFAKEGVPVRVVDCDIGRQCLDIMLGGSAHIATVANSPIVFASLRGARLAVLATMTTARNYNKIITRGDTGIAALPHLAGRRVGTFSGTSAQYYLHLSLMLAGVDPASVVLVSLEPSEAVAALAAGKVDALAIFEPYAYQAAAVLGPRVRMLGPDRPHGEYWNVVATEDALHSREIQLERLCRALQRAERFIAEDPASARGILRTRLGLDDKAIEWSWPDLQFRLQLSQSLITSLEGQARWAIRSGYAAGPAPNYLDYVRAGVLARAVPGSVRITQ